MENQINQINEINKYGNGKIYKLNDKTNGNIYIGSTIKTIEQRLLEHRNAYKSYLNGKYHFVTSFKILKNNNYSIELLELYPCNNKKELTNKESWYIRNLDCVNKKIEGRTIKEYYIDNRDALNNKHKQHYYDNKKIRLNYQNKYNRQKYICICGKEIEKGNKTHHKRTKKHKRIIEQLNNNPQE